MILWPEIGLECGKRCLKRRKKECDRCEEEPSGTRHSKLGTGHNEDDWGIDVPDIFLLLERESVCESKLNVLLENSESPG